MSFYSFIVSTTWYVYYKKYFITLLLFIKYYNKLSIMVKRISRSKRENYDVMPSLFDRPV